jgi:hypothetical protein
LSQLSKNNIITQLEIFEFNREAVDEDFIIKRLKAKEKVEFCNRCLSKFILFINDPELYSQVIKDNEDLFPNKNYFPLGMLQESGPPLELLEIMKKEVLELIKDSEDEILEQIFLKVSACDITDRYR